MGDPALSRPEDSWPVCRRSNSSRRYRARGTLEPQHGRVVQCRDALGHALPSHQRDTGAVSTLCPKLFACCRWRHTVSRIAGSGPAVVLSSKSYVLQSSFHYSLPTGDGIFVAEVSFSNAKSHHQPLESPGGEPWHYHGPGVDSGTSDGGRKPLRRCCSTLTRAN